MLQTLERNVQTFDARVLSAAGAAALAELTGPAVPAALGSGNPCTEDQIGQMSCHTFHGTAQLIIKVSEAGKIGIAVRSGGLQTGYAAVHAV